MKWISRLKIIYKCQQTTRTVKIKYYCNKLPTINCFKEMLNGKKINVVIIDLKTD